MSTFCSTLQTVVLPPPPPSNRGNFRFFLRLDPLSNEHKVFMIRFPRFPIRDLPYITITDYALSTGCWSNTRTREEYHYGWNLGMSLYANGVMHWMCREKSAVGDPTCDASFLSFDVASKAFSLTSLPGRL
uniref:F-box associated domain-containing protein n=1 Tax=Opuntia streptacantha TaxID=393608 RepID=A0A7C8ZWJ6_OPUST